MEVYVRENLYVLDYNNNIVDTIFISGDHRTAGYAYNVTITEENTGYSDLKFDMPNTIIDAEGNTVKNPKLALLTPLVKLRYRRQVFYTGSESITVREPSGYGDTVTYVDKTYSNTYPDNIIEDYIMDYIVQPVDKKRDVLKLTTSYTAIDYPRFNLSKKRVGLEISDDTVTKEEWSLFKNKPLDVAGTIKYQQWTSSLSEVCGKSSIPLEWDPEHSTEYPLTKTEIIKLMANTASWPYGLLATAFYWPITSTARFEGTLYKKGGFLVLQLYDFYYLSTEGIDPDLYVDRYSWDWTQLYEVDSYLCPNNAANYLHYILEGTNWTVAQRYNETTGEYEDDIDIVQSAIPTPAGSLTSYDYADDTCSISVSGSNCYNAITAVCQGLQLYPIYNCEDRTVALRVFAGKNYGLAYRLGSNINSDSYKLDGEKVITKLYCTGGTDYDGDEDINIGTAERSYTKYMTGFYASVSDAPTSDVEGYWIVTDDFSSSDFTATKYNEDMSSYTETVHDNSVNQYWEDRGNRKVYFYNNSSGSWTLGTELSTGYWEGTVNGTTYIVDPETGCVAEDGWNPNDDAYICSRSPYGTNYILNLKWAYQNNWITKEQILELYQIEKQIHDLDYMFMDGYTEDRRTTQQEYNDAVNNYDIAQDEYQSTLNSMMSKYYNDEEDISEGSTYCFHKAPQGTYTKSDGKHYIKLFHCYGCSKTEALAPSGSSAPSSVTTCPDCSSTDVSNEEIYIPVYADYEDLAGNDINYPQLPYEGYDYNPHLKGYFLRLVISLDNANKDWDIGDYEDRVSMIEPIDYAEGTATIDGYDYLIDGVYVRATSGQIEVWNEAVAKYINAYGNMLDYLREVNGCLERIKILQELYDKWDAQRDAWHAEIQEKFGDYLIEGNYTNDEQPYVGLLFQEGLEASDKYSVPEVTYELNVVDATGLVEYREPRIDRFQCEDCTYTTYTPITVCPKCGGTNIKGVYDNYNDLVRKLHNVGQIVPKAGDYVTVYDEPMGMYGVSALVTEITRYLDSPYSNKISLDTSYTDDEELVGNIITATNTVLSNADIYARTAVLKSDGTIDSTSIKNTLDNSNADITIVGTNGNVLLNGSGLRCSNPSDSSCAMKYAGNGVFCTTNLSNDSEAVTWEKMMTPTGIIATYINAGTIDTNKINIMSGLSGKVLLDNYGLYVKTTASKSAHITEFDSDAAKLSSTYASTWGSDNNIAAFIGVDNSNNPLVYTKGFLYAEEGSNIAGWITDSSSLYHLNSSSKKDIWLSPSGISGTVNNSGTQTFALYANGNFGVTTGGTLYASGVNINGTIACNSASTINGTLGQVAADSVTLSAAGVSGTVNSHTDNWAIYSKGNFGVTTSGYLYATGANISGTIYATSGTFNGTINTVNLNASGTVTIQDAQISSATLTSCSISAAQITSGTLSSARIPNLEANKITSGMLEISNDTGFLVMGYKDYWVTHPYVSALNVATQGSNLGGISFRDSMSQDDPGNEIGRIACSSLKAMSVLSNGTVNINHNADGQVGGAVGICDLVIDGNSISGSTVTLKTTDNLYIQANELQVSSDGSDIYTGVTGTYTNFISLKVVNGIIVAAT